ncbi:hypothetical protein HanRHA438_Chr02g0091801 [Helianthus annuus]|nr:hypothetical protein HanRHA438_Chr02g0091801 [Helianthus annuus]
MFKVLMLLSCTHVSVFVVSFLPRLGNIENGQQPANASIYCWHILFGEFWILNIQNYQTMIAFRYKKYF